MDTTFPTPSKRRRAALIIHHHSPLFSSSQILDDTPKWVQSWKELARDIAADPVMRNRVMLDIINEPDSRGIKWQTGPKGVGMATYYEQAMDAIHSVHPSALLLLEGAGQLGTVAMNWGDGFATDNAVVAAGGVESARPFFEKMMGKPYLRNIVIAPHIYPPSVSTHHEPEVVNAPGLFSRLDNSFGTLTKKGFCPAAGGECVTFPVVFGETGSKMNAEDLKMLRDFARYMTAGTAGHNAMPNMLWWDWNANSGDTGKKGEKEQVFVPSPSIPTTLLHPLLSLSPFTGGLVQDDWTSINWNKIALLTDMSFLKPWYQTVPGVSGTAPGVGSVPSPQPLPNPPPPPPSGGGGGGGGVPPPPPPPPPSVPAGPPGSCTARVTAATYASGGGGYGATINVAINSATRVSVPYEVALQIPGLTSVGSAWNWKPAAPSGGVLKGQVSESWQALGGQTATLGLTATGSSSAMKPTAVTVGGKACTLVS